MSCDGCKADIIVGQEVLIVSRPNQGWMVPADHWVFCSSICRPHKEDQ